MCQKPRWQAPRLFPEFAHLLLTICLQDRVSYIGSFDDVWMNMAHHRPRLEDLFLTRRDFLRRCGIGFGMLGLAGLAPQLATAAPEGVSANSPLAPRSPHFAVKAKRVIHIFANGGPS